MVNTGNDRDTRARDTESRPEERARDRAVETGPSNDGQDGAGAIHREEEESPDTPRACHRRGCNEPAAFVVLERYQEETGHGAVEAEASLCREHTAEESPANLEGVYENYVFRVDPI